VDVVNREVAMFDILNNRYRLVCRIDYVRLGLPDRVHDARGISEGRRRHAHPLQALSTP